MKSRNKNRRKFSDAVRFWYLTYPAFMKAWNSLGKKK